MPTISWTVADEAAWAQVAADLARPAAQPVPGRQPGRRDKVQNALSPELSWIRGPAERRFVLGALAELPPGSGLDLAGAVRAAGLAVAAAAGRNSARRC